MLISHAECRPPTVAVRRRTLKIYFLSSTLVLVGAVASSLATRAPPLCQLSLELIDSGTGNSVPGLVRIEDLAGKAVVPEGLLSRGEGLEADSPLRRWWVAPQPVVFPV